MPSKLLPSLASLFLPFATYGASTTYGAYQRKQLSHSISDGKMYTDSQLPVEAKPPAADEWDTLFITSGTLVTELVVVDAAVADKQALYRGLKPGVEIIEIESGKSGLLQLGNILGRYKNLAAVHIVSHADEGVLLLGNSRITSETVKREVELFSAINGAVRQGGDLLFYGCNLAAGDSGNEFLHIMQKNVHLNIAASTDATGAAEEGGDWDLEIQTGQIDSGLPFSDRALLDFRHVLVAADGTIDFTSGWTDGGAILTSTDFKVAVKHDSGTRDASIYANEAYIGGAATMDAGIHFYVYADGTNTGSFELTGVLTDEYHLSTSNFTNVRVVGVLAGGGEITSTAINGTATQPEEFRFDTELSSFSGQRLSAFKIYFEEDAANGGGGAPDFGFLSFSIANAQAPDVTPPVFQNTTPSVSGTTMTQTTLTVRLDEIGTAYYVVVADGAGAPSSAQVKAGQDSGGSAALKNGTINVSSAGSDFTADITGLSSGTAYDIYVVAQDDEGSPNVQASPTKVDMATASPDSDGTLTAAAGVTEPVALPTTADSVGEAVNVFDFTLADAGTSDGLAMTVSQVVLNVTGTTLDAVRGNIIWRLNGSDVSNVQGTYDAGTDTITFSGLSISIANSASEIYTVNAYYSDNTGLTEDQTILFSVDGDTDLTVGGSGTQMAAGQSAVTNGTGTTIDVTATGFSFTTQPAGSVSGSALSTQPVVAAIDAFGNTDVDFAETITVTEASAGSLANNSLAATNGVATFTNLTYTATADQQSFTLTANDQDGVGTDLPTVAANAVTSDVVATQLIFSTQPAPTTINSGVSTDFTTDPVVQAVDANNTLDTGYSTNTVLSVTDPNDGTLDGTVNSMTATGDADGSGATVTLTPSSGSASFTNLALQYTNSGASESIALRATSGGLSAINSSTITSLMNNAPAIGNLNGDSSAWAGVGNTVSLDSGGNAAGSDTELDALNGGNGDYSGGSLTVQRSGGAVTSDTFGFDISGALFTVSGSNLEEGGLTFATFTNTNGVLTISFTSSGTTATTALVSDVLQRVAYRNDTPAGDAIIRYTLSDGSASGTADVTVTSDTIYITETTDTATIDATNGTSFSEAIAIAAADGSGIQTLIVDSTLAGATVSASSLTNLSESLALNLDAASEATISGGTLTLGGGTALTINNGTGDTASISTVFAGTGSLVKAGDGTVTLTGTQTYSGTTTFTGGTVSVAGDSHLGSGQLVLNGGTLSVTGTGTIDNATNIAAASTFNHSTAVTLSGLLSGSQALTLTGSGELVLSNTGNEASSSAGITVTSGLLSVGNDDALPSGIITLNGGAFSSNGLSGNSVTIDNSFVIGASGGTFDIYGGGGDYTTVISGVISGTGNLLKSSASKLSLTGTNTYTGTTTVQAGQIIIAGDSNLGSGSVVMSGGTLAVTGAGVTIDNNIVMSGAGALSNANDISWSGVISGTGTLSKSDVGTLALSGTQTHTGDTTVSSGSISIAGDSNIGSGTITLNGGNLTVTGSGVTIDNGLSIGASNGTVTNANAVTLPGVISGSGSPTKAGAGTLTVSGTNTNTGLLTVSAGTVAVTGTVASPVSISNGAILAGSGTFAGLVTVNSGGTIQVGASPGTMTLSSGLTLNSGGTLVARINGTTAGTTYDQYNVSGTVTLGGTLNVIGSHTGTGGESFVIISNDSTDAVSSTFNGLAEGDESTSLNGIPLAVTYLGSSGNDVTLSTVAPNVTDGNIAISGASGIGGTYKIGDTLTVTWDDTAATGDNNGNITGVTVNFTAFGGGAADAASNSSGVWTATYTITSGVIDSTNLNVSITATNTNTISTTADSTNAALDNTAPTVTDAYISISGASGTGGTYIIGDIVTATWNNTASGDNNADTVSGATVDFSAFGGGAAVAATNSSGTWTATYVLAAGAIESANLNLAFTATDNAGNMTTTTDTSNATVDNRAPTGHSVSFDDNSLNGTEASAASFTFAAAEVGASYSYTISSSAGGTPVTGTGTLAIATDSISGIDLSGLNDGTLTLSVTVTDAAGNSATAVTANAALDQAAPAGQTVTFDDTAINTAEATSIGFTFAGAEVGATYSYSLSSDGGGTSLTGSGTFATASDQVAGLDVSGLSDGTLTLSVTVTDSAGNAANAITATTTLDQTVPTVAISSGATNPTNAAFSAIVTFNESVSGFVVGDITAGNASLSNFTDNGGGSFGVTVTPTADGTVTLNIAAAVTQDGAANDNVAAAEFSLVYDGTSPTLSSSNPADNSSSAVYNGNVVLTFSEAVTAGSGSALALYNAADDTLVEPIAVADASISSNVVTLDLVNDLVPTQSYYVNVAGTAFVDAAGNAYAGISDKTSLNFSVSNAAPVAVDDAASVNEDQAIAIAVLNNDTDGDSSLNAASVIVGTAPSNGSTSVDTGTGAITYTPALNFNGTDTFTYSMQDVYGGQSNSATVTVTVNAVNDAPVAVADTANTPEDNAISINVAANDTDIDVGDSVDTTSLVLVTAPVNGSAVVTAGEFVYTPTTDFNGTDSFTYTIKDQSGAVSNAATVVVNVTGVNDLPDAANDSASVDEDGAVDIDVLANDSDIDGTIDGTTVMILSDASHGQTQVDALTGVVTYTPAADYHGSDSFTYLVRDDSDGSSNAATVTLTVNSINDAPVALADTAMVQEDTPHQINVLGNDSDIDGTLTPATVEIVTAASFGSTTVDATTGVITFDPAGNYNGSDSFSYRVQDNDGAWSPPATVTITVMNVNDEPLANSDSATTDEDTAVVIDLLANDADLDGTLDASSLIIAQPGKGSVVDNGDGSVTYTPTANINGGDSFSYTVADDQGGVSNSATVSVTVTPVNDAPTISGTPASSVAQGDSYSFTPVVDDIDSTNLSFSVTNLPAWASFDSATGTISGTPGNGDVGSDSGIVISVTDGEYTVSLAAFAISLTNTNDAPTISGTPAASVAQGASYSFIPQASDADPDDSLTFSVSNLPSWLSFDSTTGAITGVPGNSNVGTSGSITISVNDGTVSTALPAFSISVINVNDAPVATADSYSLSEGVLLIVDAMSGILANDFDIDGDNLTLNVISAPRNASSFNVGTNGSFSYQHNGTETRRDSLTYTLSDGIVTTDPVTVDFAIAAVNDAPLFDSQAVIGTVVQGESYTHVANLTDPDSVTTLSLLNGPAWLQLDGNVLSGTAPLDALGNVDVTLRATDGEYTVDQNIALQIVARELPVVAILPTWKTLPARVGDKITLALRVEQSFGPAVSNGLLRVRLKGLSTGATMAGCTQNANTFDCATALSNSAPASFNLVTTPDAVGNLVAELRFIDNATETTFASNITDVSISTAPVSQSNAKFNLANAISIATIDLIADNDKELVAGTGLGNTVKLLDYDFQNRTQVTVVGEIENRGKTVQVIAEDIDMDSLNDLVVVNSEGDASSVYYDRGGVFEVEPASQTLPNAKAAILRDLDDDGLPELLLTRGGFNLYLYHNVNGVYSEAPYVFTSPSSVMHFALLKRKPGDAPLSGSLVVSSKDAVQVVRFGLLGDATNGQAKGSGADADEPRQMAASTAGELTLANVTAIRLQDTDGDGIEEVLLSSAHDNASATQSGVTVLQVNNDDTLQTVAAFGDAAAQKLETADFNGDGQLDLLVANNNGTYQFYLGDSTNSGWKLKDVVIFEDSPLSITEDFDGDGLSDVLVYRDEQAQVEIYTTAASGNVGAEADLQLITDVTVSSDSHYRMLYQAEVTNLSRETATATDLTVDLDAGLTPVALPDNCTQDEQRVTCTLGDLTTEAVSTVQFTLQGSRQTMEATITSRAFSAALDDAQTNNQSSDSLTGLFAVTSARVKGGGNSGGALSWHWLCLFAGLAALQRRLRGRACLLALALLLSSQSHSASESDTVGWQKSYIEVSAGLATSSWSPFEFAVDLSGVTQEASLGQFDDRRTAWSLLGGYELNDWLALEAGYRDWGHVDVHVDAITSNPDGLSQLLKDNYPVSGAGPYIGARFSQRPDTHHELYFKAGAWSWDGEYRLTVGGQEELFEKSSVDLMLGAGVNVFFTESVGAGLLIEHVRLEGQRQMNLGVGVVWRF